RSKSLPIHPEEKQREKRNEHRGSVSNRSKEKVKEIDIDDHRPEQQQPKRGEAPAEEDQPTDDLQDRDDLEVAAGKHGAHECSGLAGWWRHRDEVQECIKPEDDEDEPEQ